MRVGLLSDRTVEQEQQQVRQVGAEPNRGETMLLSDAIIRGCASYPRQAFYSLFGDGGESACVIGAGLAGSGHGDVYWKSVWTAEEFDELNTCPTGDGYQASSLWLLVHLNDHHGWTREQIAEWLRDSGNDIEVESNLIMADDVINLKEAVNVA